MAESAVGNQWDMEVVGMLHLLEYDGFYVLFLLGQDLEVQFVVDLQDHLAPDALLFEPFMDAYHRHLDNVGCRALNRCVDGISFSKAAHRGVL